MLKAVATLVLLIAGTATPALAQKSLAEIKAEAAAGSGELAEVDAMLADADPNIRAAAMVALLGSGNVAFVQRAMEAGLLSSDPAMRAFALKAVFDAGGPVRLVLDLSGLEGEPLKKWLDITGDYGVVASDGKSAAVLYDVRSFDDENRCYLSDRGYCLLRLNGTDVDFDIGNSNIRGFATLSDQGLLVGSLSYSGYEVSVPLAVKLLD